MTMQENLLIEIGTEELPPKSLRALAEAFADNLQASLKKSEFGFAQLQWYASPRRLALMVSAIETQQPDKIVEKKGPAVSAAFDAEGNPTKAAMGWARGNGIEVSDAQRLKTEKGEWLLHKAEVKGQSLTTVLADLVSAALAKLPIPKPMRWGSESTQFIRPVHTVTMLLGQNIVDGTVLGKDANRMIQGHRFHSPGLHSLDHADNYLAMLESLRVMACFKTRKQAIKSQLETLSAEHNAVIADDDDLLEEVTGLVEWPVSLVGTFEEKFLSVPSEALIYSMKDNQKYFPMSDHNNNLLSKFIFVSNIESKDPQQVIDGNEKVVRPRLADAEFFFETDKKSTLESRLASLESVLFQKQLGTLGDKSKRISSLAGYIADKIGADKALSERAGLLSKTDLMTEMVMEFPEVQGVMGMYYAKHDGEHQDVANALNEQYQPRYAGDELPASGIACAVALADKFDTLVGIFGINQPPKGDKDPFALRRAAIGALRIMMEKELALDIVDVASFTAGLYGDKISNANTVNDVTEFLLGRFRSWYQEKGVEVDTVQAVLARKPTKPHDFDQRINAVSAFRKLPASAALAAANKRVGNILAKFDGQLPTSVNASLLSEPAEIALHQAVESTSATLGPVFEAGDYTQALTVLAELREVTDNFFDNVMVMADDEALRLNRLTLLASMRELFLNIADISVLQN